MSYWCDDRSLALEQSRLDAQQVRDRHHPDDIAAVKAATLAKHLPTIKAVQAAAAPVLAGKDRK